MAQHDYNIANQSGADFRADLNNALLAIATVNSGSTEPATTFAHQLWVDTSSSVLKIRNAADNAWITTGVSITASNTFTGDLTGNVTGNLTGNVTGNVTGDLTGNADSADILTTARTISLSGDVVGSVSFDGGTNVDIDTVVQINSIVLGTDTTGDYVESMSGGTGVTVTGGTGEGSTPSIAIGQAVATSDDVTFNNITASNEFIGDIDGAVRFTAKTDEALSKGDVVYVSGVSGNTTTVGKAKADDASKMPAFGMAIEDANANNNLQIVTFGNLTSIDTSNESVGEILYVSTTAGEYTTTAPSGESAQIQNIGKVLRSHAVNGSIKVGGAGRSNATPNLDNGKIFIGNGSNQSTTTTLDTSIVVENTNLYYTTARANTDFDSRLATKDTGDLTEGSNLYYTTARANTDFDTRLATKSTTNLTEGTNLYYTTARFDSAFTSKDTDDLSEGTTNLYYTTTRFDSAFGNKTTADLTENTNLYYTDTRANSAIDARVTKAFVDALGIQANTVAANSVALGTDTTGNYIQTITGTANKITVSGSGSESADVTLSLPDDVQIADSLTVAGNLTVNGTLTSLDTTNLDIEDNLFQLNAGLTGSPVNDSGMLINRGTSDNSIFMWDESVDKFTMGLTTADGSATGNITLNSLGTLVVNVEGNVTGQVSDISNFTTANLTENTNLYYTDARSRAAISATGDISYNSSTGVISFTQSVSPVTSVNTLTGAVVLDTDDVGEGLTNVYYTNARADTRINLQTGANLDLSSKSTSSLSEGSNLYYTDARVQAVSINNVVEDTTPQLGGNLDLNSSDITGTGDINITGTIQSSGNITGTLATAAQPNITSLGTLTGLTSTGNLVIGTEDNNAAIIEISGGATGSAEGGEIRLDTAADYDSTYEFYRLDVSQDDFRIGRQGQTDFTLFSDGTAQFFGNLAATLSTAAQPNVTSVGTLSGLTVSGDLLVDTNTLFVDSSEDVVGINTTSNLNQTLNVLGTSSDTIDETTGVVKFEATGGNGLLFGTQASSPYRSYIQSAYTIDTSLAQYDLLLNPLGGNVGIANASPNAQLHIGDSSAEGNTTNPAIQIGGTTTYRLGMYTSSEGAVIENKNGDDGIQFRVKTAGEAMRIDGGTGIVHIGEGTAINDTNVKLQLNAPSGGEASLGINDNGAYALLLQYTSGTGARIRNIKSTPILFEVNNAERMRINSAGTIYQGTTSPTLHSATTGIVFENGSLLNDVTRGVGKSINLAQNAAVDSGNTWAYLATDEASLYQQFGGNHYFYTAPSGSANSDITFDTKMFIANTGNVGIATSSPTEKLTVNGALAITGALADDRTSTAAMDFSGGVTRFVSYGASGTGGQFAFRTASGGSSSVERLRIDDEGHIGINMTPSPVGNDKVLSIYESNTPRIKLHNASTGTAGTDGGEINMSGTDFILENREAGNLRLFNNGSERMRIDSSGSLLVGTTSSYADSYHTIARNIQDDSGDAVLNVVNLDTTAAVYNTVLAVTAKDAVFTGVKAISFRKSGGEIAAIQMSSSAVTYNTSSDYRLKENIKPIQNGLKRLNQLNPVKFDWKEDGTSSEGFIAHEVQEIFSDAISGEKDDKYMQGMDYGRITPLLVKAIQEQQTIIDDLKSRIETLEG